MVSIRFRVAVISTLLVSTLFGSHRAMATQFSPSEGNDSIKTLMNYLWPLLSSSGKSGRIYYHAVCPPSDHYPLELPKLDVRRPSSSGADLAAIRSIFRRDQDITVTEDQSGLVRIRIGDVPDTILHTRISMLSFDAISQYNLLRAIDTIEGAPEVQSMMSATKLTVPVRLEQFLVIPPTEGYPHLPAQISNVTMDQELDVVAKTWGGIIFYGSCSPPDTYEISFDRGLYP